MLCLSMLAFVLWVEAEGKEEEKTGEAWANAVSLHCLSGFAILVWHP